MRELQALINDVGSIAVRVLCKGWVCVVGLKGVLGFMVFLDSETGSVFKTIAEGSCF